MSVADLIDEHASNSPFKKALYFPQSDSEQPSYTHLTYQQLKKRADKVADGLRKRGVKKGTKVLLFVRPSLEFPVIAYALFKIGAVAILIDPGMGRKNLFKCIEEVEPKVLIAVPEVFLGKKIFPKVFRSIECFVILDQSNSFKTGLAKLLNPNALNFVEIEETGKPLNYTEKMGADDLAAIVFTSGGTGRPKGVEYTHAIYEHQVDLLKKTYSLTTDDIDLPAFPLFALFTLAMGMTVVIPDMDPTKPAKACPEKLVSHIKNHGVTFAGGSPAIWEKVGHFCKDKRTTLQSLKSLMMFGAPVSAHIHEDFEQVLPNGTTYTPYGATECLPVATISGTELLANKLAEKSKQGHGTCVGKPADKTEVKIIAPVEGIIPTMSDAKIQSEGEIGEIIVRGPQATSRYYKLADKTALAKISDGESFWHRMGDLGYKDAQGRLWFCGRMVHSFEFANERLYSVPTESHFNNHPDVKRSALINFGSSSSAKPGLVIEPKYKKLSESLKQDLIEISKKAGYDKKIGAFFVHDSFPVDIRHNIKIDRAKLASEARQGNLMEL